MIRAEFVKESTSLTPLCLFPPCLPSLLALSLSYSRFNIRRFARHSHVPNVSRMDLFYSHLTRTTTWEDPRKTAAAANVAAVAAAAIESGKSNSGGAANSLGPLPDGWEQARTDAGEIYFINHQDRSTSWFDPRIRKWSTEGRSTKFLFPFCPDSWFRMGLLKSRIS